MTEPRVLVAGIGNIFLGDDGFGVEVAQRLTQEPFPEWVKVEDFGIRGVHLAYELLNGYETAILVDATARGGDPGTLYVIEPDLGPAQEQAKEVVSSGATPLLDAHGMEPGVVLSLLDSLGGSIDRVLVVGCEPADTEERMGLSEPVAAAVAGAVELVRELVQQEEADRSMVGERKEGET